MKQNREASSHWESNPGPWFELQCTLLLNIRQPPALPILHIRLLQYTPVAATTVYVLSQQQYFASADNKWYYKCGVWCLQLKPGTQFPVTLWFYTFVLSKIPNLHLFQGGQDTQEHFGDVIVNVYNILITLTNIT